MLNTEEALVLDFDKVKRKTLKTWNEVSKEKKLAVGDSEANLVLESVTGKELTVSLVSGNKSAFLFGFGEVASGLGFKDGDIGKSGTFRFDYMSPAAFARAKKSAERVSKGTLDKMLKGDTNKFKRNNLRNIIKRGIKEGRPSSDIAKDVSKFFDDSKYWKAAEITRTEIPMAYNMGRIDAAKTDGLKKARVELGGRPCQWCIDNHGDVRTLTQAETYMSDHHPINDCTVVPLISFEDYGLEPPPGYEGEDEGPLTSRTKVPGSEVRARADQTIIDRINEIAKDAIALPTSPIMAPDVPDPRFYAQMRQRYRDVEFLPEGYSKEKAQRFLDVLEQLHRKSKLDTKVSLRLQKKPLKVILSSDMPKDIHGLYVEPISGKSAYIRLNANIPLDGPRLRYAMTHEYGHHMKEVGLSMDQGGEWFSKHIKENSITTYGMTNVDEDFCESLTTFMHNPELLKVYAPKAYELLRSIFRAFK